MRSRKKVGVALGAACLSLVVAACGGESDKGGDVPDEKVSKTDADRILDAAKAGPAKECTTGKGLTIGGAVVWSSNAGGKAFNDAFKAAAKACEATPLLVEAKADDPINSMISAMDLVTSKKADVTSFFPLSPDAMTTPSKRAVAAGIPVVAGELSNFDDAAITFHQDRLTGAANSARLFCDKYPDGGGVIYGAYGFPQADLVAMQKRFTAEVKKCSDGKITVVGTYQNKTDDIAGGLSTAQAALQQHPDAVGVVAYSDTNAVAASRAATNLGVRDKLTIVGYNVDAVGHEALSKGVIDYSFLWGQAEQGALTVKYMIDLARGDKAPKYVTLYPKCISKETIKSVPTIAVRTLGIGQGRDLEPTGLAPTVTSDDEPLLEADADLRASVACPVD